MIQPYSLVGTEDCPQVEPEASYWFECPVLRQVSIDEVLAKLGTLTPYPTEGSPQEADEIATLKQLYHDRYEPFDKDFLSDFLSDEQEYYRPAPPRAILPRTRIRHLDHYHYLMHAPDNGAELATLFEGETPGEWHRHVLNVLFDPGEVRGFCQTLSPPRQALIWATLDMAIVSALSAAWFLKWRAEPGIGRRRRPWEADNTLKVLFDYKIHRRTGAIRRPESDPKDGSNGVQLPQPTPGTPRHPAYTSGHSTYAAAASKVLGCFFPEHRDSFAKLADNIGTARLYGGVHWPTDHKFGMQVGEAVGDLIMEQLNKSGIKVDATPDPATGYAPPPFDELNREANDFKNHCGQRPDDFCDKVTATKRASNLFSTVQFASSSEE